MSISLKRGTVAVEPHRIEWDIAAQEVMNKLKDILQEDIVDLLSRKEASTPFSLNLLRQRFTTLIPISSLRDAWDSIINDNNHHLIVCEVDDKLVASCVCVIIPNLTRNVHPYAFVENVVTHGDYRKKGYATACLNFAKQIAKKNNCYKMMLLTGSKEESTLNFYRNGGYNSSDKTAFIQWIDM